LHDADVTEDDVRRALETRRSMLVLPITNGGTALTVGDEHGLTNERGLVYSERAVVYVFRVYLSHWLTVVVKPWGVKRHRPRL
jgi:hypothetical protein